MTQSTLTGKRIIITGGSIGIGYACAEEILKQDATVTIAARSADVVGSAVENLAGKGFEGQIFGIVGDVSSVDAVERIFQESAAKMNGLDGLVHAAAILGPIGRITDVTPTEWLRTIEINLFGTFLVARQAARVFSQSQGGRIVTFSGGGGSSGWPNYTAYGCSKVGVVRFVESVSEELADSNISINAIAPGFVVTRMQDQTLAAGERAGVEYLKSAKRQVEQGGVPPEKAARLAAFLLSDRSAGITGKLISAVHDDWENWPDHLDELRATDIFTLRRILPRERGMSWQ